MKNRSIPLIITVYAVTSRPLVNRYNSLILRFVFPLLAISLLAGCTTFHDTKSILFEPLDDIGSLGAGGDDQKFPCAFKDVASMDRAEVKSYFGSNPVFVRSGSKFSIEIEKVFPGYIRPEKKDPFRIESDKQEAKKQDAPWPYAHFRDHSLWLVIKVSSLDPADPLETKSKHYFKATSIKREVESFSYVPLDERERIVFTHEADSAYRVSMRLYEVDNEELKRFAMEAADNPGLAGLANGIWATARNTFGAILGDYFEKRWKDYAAEPLAIERLLLGAGATEEFVGELLVLRIPDVDGFDDRLSNIDFTTNLTDNVLNGLFEERWALLYDYYKYDNNWASDKFSYRDESSVGTAQGDPTKEHEALNERRGKQVNICEKGGQFGGHVLLRISQSPKLSVLNKDDKNALQLVRELLGDPYDGVKSAIKDSLQNGKLEPNKFYETPNLKERLDKLNKLVNELRNLEARRSDDVEKLIAIEKRLKELEKGLKDLEKDSPPEANSAGTEDVSAMVEEGREERIRKEGEMRSQIQKEQDHKTKIAARLPDYEKIPDHKREIETKIEEILGNEVFVKAIARQQVVAAPSSIVVDRRKRKIGRWERFLMRPSD